MKKAAVWILLTALLLTGCSSLTEGTYVSVVPFQPEGPAVSQDIISVSNYIELRNALCLLAENGTQSATISVDSFAPEMVDINMGLAIRYVTHNNPIGSYAVKEITYESGVSGGAPAVAVNITYEHNRAEIRRIRQVSGMEDVRKAIQKAMELCEDSLVLYVSNFNSIDYAQIVSSYAQDRPDLVMETPELTTTVYPESGVSRILEFKFTYQMNRDSLRDMQQQVKDIFDSAKLYVSEGTEEEQYAQLYSFLAGRHTYQEKTSITPAYSLLLHGVGDSRAMATVYAAMCRRAGLNCLVITGTRMGEPWYWNMICKDGIYYHVDMMRCIEQGRFFILSEYQLSSYVWDYSMYPAYQLTPSRKNESELPTETTVPDSTEE